MHPVLEALERCDPSNPLINFPPPCLPDLLEYADLVAAVTLAAYNRVVSGDGTSLPVVATDAPLAELAGTAWAGAVTADAAGVAGEEALRAALETAHPSNGMSGKNTGGGWAVSGRRWLVDAVDRPETLAAGQPFWSAIITVQSQSFEHHDGELAESTDAVVITAPAMGRLWFAVRGFGAYSCSVNGDAPVAQRISAGQSMDVAMGIAELDVDSLMLPVLQASPRIPGRLGIGWSQMLVAEGLMPLAIASNVDQVHDVLGLRLLLEESGGRLSTIQNLRGDGGVFVLSSNERIHDHTLVAIGPQPLAESRTFLARHFAAEGEAVAAQGMLRGFAQPAYRDRITLPALVVVPPIASQPEHQR